MFLLFLVLSCIIDHFTLILKLTIQGWKNYHDASRSGRQTSNALNPLKLTVKISGLFSDCFFYHIIMYAIHSSTFTLSMVLYDLYMTK